MTVPLRHGVLGAALAAHLFALAATPLPAQRPRVREPADVELELLRAASAREASSDLVGAERLLRLLLERQPTSPAGVLALERVLRARGAVREVLPVVDALLAREPGSPVGHHLRLRVMAELDSLAGVTEAAEAWMQADPRSGDPYREVARIFEQRVGSRAGVRILERGRAAIGDSAALALEMGEVLIRAGDVERGVAEWSRSLSDDARDLSSVLRHLARLRDRRPELAARLVDVLVTERTTLARRRAAAQVAVEAALDERALRVAAPVAAELDGRARTGFLADLARRAEDAGARRTALWAYVELRATAQHAGERLALDLRIADAAEAAGNRGTAVEAYQRVARSSEAGSPERRRALVAMVRLAIARGEFNAARAHLDELREEHPGAPELDRLAADVSVWLEAKGEIERAREVLRGVEGPWSARERAYLLLASGELEAGRAQLLEAARALPAAEATSAIAIARVLGKVGPNVGRAVAEAAVLARRGRARDAEERLMGALGRAAPEERPTLLALAAQLADAVGEDERALALRRRIAREHVQAPEAAEAMLQAARVLGRRPGMLGEASALLERLILAQPESALVPQARRELERLKGRVPRL